MWKTKWTINRAEGEKNVDEKVLDQQMSTKNISRVEKKQEEKRKALRDEIRTV